MALQRNVVYTVTRWMDEWMDWWMDGWMLLKIQTPTSEGWSRSWTLVWSLSLLFWCQSYGRVFTFFCPVVLEKRRGCSENPADMKTVRYCFVTFFLNFLSNLHFKSPPFLHLDLCEATSKAVGTTQSHFSLCFFFLWYSKLYDVGGKKNKMMSELKLALSLCFTCISVKDLHPFQSFYKPLSPYSVHPKTMERDCERQVNRDKDGDSGGQRPQTYKERTNRSCDETQIRVFSHIKRHLKSHSKPVMEKKTTCFLSPKTVYNKERKTQEEAEKNVPCSQTTFPLTL